PTMGVEQEKLQNETAATEGRRFAPRRLLDRPAARSITRIGRPATVVRRRPSGATDGIGSGGAGRVRRAGGEMPEPPARAVQMPFGRRPEMLDSDRLPDEPRAHRGSPPSASAESARIAVGESASPATSDPPSRIAGANDQTGAGGFPVTGR